MVTSHSPFFVDGLKPKEVWVVYRDDQGYTQAKCTADIPGIQEFINSRALLGQLWMKDYFNVGNPLIDSQKITSYNKLKISKKD
jgi:hypothetical protein